MSTMRLQPALVAAVKLDQAVITSGNIEGDQERISYRLVAEAREPSGPPETYEYVTPSHARPWPRGVSGAILSASVGDTAVIVWYGDETHEEARFHIAESIAEPVQCPGAAP